MNNGEYIRCLMIMFKKLNNAQLKRVYEYVHRIYLGCAGD